MPELETMVDEVIGQLDGERANDAWHALVECGIAALPRLTAAFRATRDSGLRVVLVTIVNEYADPAAAPFFALAIADPEPDVWKTVLDGLVTLGGDDALRVLREALANADAEKQPWIEGAIEQVREEPAPSEA